MAFSDGLRYFDRTGMQISKARWKVEVAETTRAIACDTVHGVTVSTIWHGVDEALPGTEPRNYYVALDDGLDDSPLICGYYVTEGAALEAHGDALARLDGGRRPLFEREREKVIPLRTREAGAKARDRREFRDVAFRGLVDHLARNWHTIVTSEAAVTSRPVAIVNHHLIVEIDPGACFGSRDAAAACGALGGVVISNVSLRVTRGAAPIEYR